MSRPSHVAPKLPSVLLDRLGSGNGNDTSASRNRKYSKPVGRKEQRKAFRQAKKKQQQRRPHQAPVRSRAAPVQEDFGSEIDESDDVQPDPQPVTSRARSAPQVPQPKSILKSTKSRDVEGPSPDFAVPPVSRAVKAKLKDDDAEIAALEKKLGLKGKKNRPKVFDDDGLRDLLDGLDDYVDGMSAKRKRTDYDEFLSGKRRHVEGSETVSEDDSNQDDATFSEDGKPAGDSESEADGNLDVDDEELDGSLSDEDDEFGGFDDVVNNGLRDTFVDSNPDHLHEDTEEEPPPPKRRENPYVAPVAASIAPSGKYIPPSMRGASTSETEELFRLRRQLQGQLNRLSEANLISILREVEGVYASHARQHVTEVLIDLLIGLLCDRTTLIDTFIILHAGFAAATYKVLGAHFGAQLLERIVSEFEKFYAAEKDEISGSKQTTNLMALLAELYTFQLIGSNLIFDYIRLFLTDLTELNTELLLKIIKNCGAQLRHDDPSSLKDIVIMLQKSVAKVGEANLPVRTKFMIEAIGDLKNNRQKTGVAASSVAAEHIARMKKTLGALNTNIKASEPLGVSLADINSSSKEGKWWLVGASWKNETQESGTSSTPARNGAEDERQDEPGATGDGDDLLQLAKEQRMNTDIRRAIFMNIMSASDYKDAHMRLTKLKLKKSQDLEIPRVLIHCAGTEQGYNPYYTLIAKRLCTEHRFKWAMQFGLWDLFKRMGEKSNNEDDSDIEIDDETDETIDLRKIVNLGRMYGQLVADDALSLTSLKVLDFAYLQPKTKTFLEILLTTTFKQLAKRSKDESQDVTGLDTAITALIMRAKDSPQVITGLQFFLSKQVDPEGLVSNNSERKVLKKALKTARLLLTQLSISLS